MSGQDNGKVAMGLSRKWSDGNYGSREVNVFIEVPIKNLSIHGTAEHLSVEVHQMFNREKLKLEQKIGEKLP